MSAIDDQRVRAALQWDFEGFSEFVFPQHGDIVYVLCFKPPGVERAVPFYVGESSRHVGRFGDYLTAHFSASTDFKVGRAVRTLQARGCEVVVRYKNEVDRKAAESSLIAAYEAAGLMLLNSLQGYRYQIALEADEMAKVEAFVAELLRQHSAREPSTDGTGA